MQYVSLQDLLPLKPATEEQIRDAEQQLKLFFSDEYKEYLAEYGAIIADGIELTGIAKSEHRNVVNVTNTERGLNSNVPNSMYVIENTGIDGIIIWQDENGYIYSTQPRLAPQRIAESMAEYIVRRE